MSANRVVYLGALLEIGRFKLTVAAIGPMAHSQGLGPVDFQAKPNDTVSAQYFAVGSIINTPWGCCEVVSDKPELFAHD